jgi:two-component system, OmpR family, sensor kinase
VSIRLRLSILFSSILALTLIVFGVVVYTTQSEFSMRWLKQDLVISSNTLSQNIFQANFAPKPPDGNANNAPQSPDAINNNQASDASSNTTVQGQDASSNTTVQGPDAGNTSPIQNPPPKIALPDSPSFQQHSEREIVRVIDPDGNAIANQSGSGQNFPALPLDHQKVVEQQQDSWQITTISDERLIIYSHPIVAQGRVFCVLQVARALTERDQSLQTLERTLIIGILLAIVVAFGFGWFVAGIALHPIERITQTAQAIGKERDFSRRVVYEGPKDEVGQLAITFNLMLAQLQDAYQKVAHALDMQRNFVADVSHELRTPLTTLRGNLGLLSRASAMPPDEHADIMSDMVSESDRLIRLVNNLLVLARADAGRSLVKEAVDVSPIIAETCRQAHQLDPKRKISVEINQDLIVQGDRDAVKQTLLILLDNALKHSGGDVAISGENAAG